MAFSPPCPIKGIQDFVNTVSYLERCKRVDPSSASPMARRSKELVEAKSVALRALKALVESRSHDSSELFSEFLRRMRCLLVLPRINNPIPRDPIDVEMNITMWTSHVLDDFLFIGPGSEFMPLNPGQPNALDPAAYSQRKLIIKGFIQKYNIRFVLNVSKELIPGRQAAKALRDYPVDLSPIVCEGMEDLKGIETEDLSLQNVQSFIGAMVPLEDTEEFTVDFERYVKVAAEALELAWRRYVLAMVRYPSQEPPRVFLHCFGGLNRSTFTAVYWLVKYHGIWPDQAWTSVLERRRPQCTDKHPPLNGVVNGKFTGKAQWKDALRRVVVPGATWPQLQLSQNVSQPIFTLDVPSSIISTAEFAARAILDEGFPKQGGVKDFSVAQSQILCKFDPVLVSVQCNPKIVLAVNERLSSRPSASVLLAAGSDPVCPTVMSKPVNGRGRWKFKDGEYDGEWRDRERDGRGLFRMDCGGSYDGRWSNDKRHGRGKHVWADGSTYEGDWSEDKQHGRGVFTFAVDGKTTLPGLDYSWNAGDRMDCGFKASARHGACAYTFFNGETFNCTWADGRCPEFTARQRIVLRASFKGSNKFKSPEGEYDEERGASGALASASSRNVTGSRKASSAVGSSAIGSNARDIGSNVVAVIPSIAHYHYLWLDRVPMSVSESDIFALFERFSANDIFYIPSQNSGLAWVGFGSLSDAHRARHDLDKRKVGDWHIYISNEIVDERRVEKIKENRRMQHAGGQTGALKSDSKGSPLTGSAALEMPKDVDPRNTERLMPRIAASVPRSDSGARHSDAAATATEHGSIICRHFARGYCERGDRCSYRHDRISQDTAAIHIHHRDIREDARTEKSSVNSSKTLAKERSNPLDCDRGEQRYIAREDFSLTVSKNDKRPRDDEAANEHEPNLESNRLRSQWGPPTNVLFLKNLPSHCTAKDINVAFNKLKGFQVARDGNTVRGPVVYAQFDTADSSTEAIISMQGKRVFPRSDHSLDIEFARQGSENKFQAIERKVDSIIDIRDGIITTNSKNKEQVPRQTADTLEAYSGKDKDRQNEDHVEGSKKQLYYDSEKTFQAIRDDRVTREVITQRHVHIQKDDGALTCHNANARGGGAESTFSAPKKYSPSGRFSSTPCKWGRTCPDLQSRTCRYLHDNEEPYSLKRRISVDEPTASRSCGVDPGASKRVKVESCAGGGTTNIPQYRSPSGRTTSVWCRFDTRCNLGSRCTFGHEIAGQAPKVPKSISTLDLRESIHSQPPASAAALDLTKLADIKKQAAAQQQQAAASEAPPQKFEEAQLQAHIIENKKQAAAEQLRRAMALRHVAADIRMELEASCTHIPMS